MTKLFLFFGAMLLLGLEPLALAQDIPADSVAEQRPGFFHQQGIAGQWGGLRPFLQDHGIDLEVSYTGEMVRNMAGGLKPRQSIYHDNLEISLNIDTEKAGLWPGGDVFVSGLRNHGGDPTANLIGDLQTASNIEAPDQFIVYEAWLEQQFADGKISILFGLHDLNSEFYVSDYAGLFINGSFGIGPEISVNVPTSIFPKAGLAGRLRIQPVESAYVQAAVYDGDPSTRGFKAGEGRMLIAEVGAHMDGLSAKAGYWRHTATHVYAGRNFNHDFGYYGVIDLRLTQWQGGEAGFFSQVGHAPKDRNDVSDYRGFGVNLTGFIPGRENDQLGIAVAQAKTAVGIEKSVEATLRLQLADWLALQPSYQWIINPGGVDGAPMARVGFVRFEVNL
ncbi:MAG TPA: carbohydrate porin [Mariprofundaceae bacterium]|nr:carbohydrate porin [Mariprofundaceae bacterium]